MYSSRYRTGEARPRPGEGREDINTGRECAAGVLGRVARAITCAAPAGTARESAPMVVCAAFDPGPGGSSRLMFGKGTLSLLHSNGSGLHNDVSLVGFAIRGGGSGFVVAPASLADFSWRPSLGASAASSTTPLVKRSETASDKPMNRFACSLRNGLAAGRAVLSPGLGSLAASWPRGSLVPNAASSAFFASAAAVVDVAAAAACSPSSIDFRAAIETPRGSVP